MGTSDVDICQTQEFAPGFSTTLRGVDDLFRKFAKQASLFNLWFENVEEDLTDPVRFTYIREIENQFKISLDTAKQELNSSQDLNKELSELTGTSTPANPGKMSSDLQQNDTLIQNEKD